MAEPNDSRTNSNVPSVSSQTIEDTPTDPFDPASCTGTRLTVDELAAQRPDLHMRLGRYEFVIQHRDCEGLLGGPYTCGPWEPGPGIIAEPDELRGDILIRKEVASDRELSLRFDSDVVCEDYYRNYGMWASTQFSDKQLYETPYTVPRPYHGSSCIAQRMYWYSTSGVLTDHCLRLEGIGHKAISHDEGTRQEYKLVILNQF